MPYKLLRAPQPTLGTGTLIPYGAGRSHELVFQVGGGGYRVRPPRMLEAPPPWARAYGYRYGPEHMERVSAHLEPFARPPGGPMRLFLGDDEGLSGYYTVSL